VTSARAPLAGAPEGTAQRGARKAATAAGGRRRATPRRYAAPQASPHRRTAPPMSRVAIGSRAELITALRV
jgi:hypothetical protein